MHPVAWMIVGGVFVFVGLVVMLSNIGDLRRRIRILRAPSLGPMVGSGTTARIEGRIVPGPEGERILVPGDMVQVVGPAHREGDDTSMRAGLGLGGELILARGTLDKLARRLRRDFVIGATLAILGVASLAIGWLRGLFIVH